MSPEQEWTDLARNPAGIGLTYEAARRRQTEGLGADRSWRVGRDGEAAVAVVPIEPPGVVAVSTKHHRAGRLILLAGTHFGSHLSSSAQEGICSSPSSATRKGCASS